MYSRCFRFGCVDQLFSVVHFYFRSECFFTILWNWMKNDNVPCTLSAQVKSRLLCFIKIQLITTRRRRWKNAENDYVKRSNWLTAELICIIESGKKSHLTMIESKSGQKMHIRFVIQYKAKPPSSCRFPFQIKIRNIFLPAMKINAIIAIDGMCFSFVTYFTAEWAKTPLNVWELRLFDCCAVPNVVQCVQESKFYWRLPLNWVQWLCA